MKKSFFSGLTAVSLFLGLNICPSFAGPADNIQELPVEVMELILDYLPLDGFFRSRQVITFFNDSFLSIRERAVFQEFFRSFHQMLNPSQAMMVTTQAHKRIIVSPRLISELDYAGIVGQLPSSYGRYSNECSAGNRRISIRGVSVCSNTPALGVIRSQFDPFITNLRRFWANEKKGTADSEVTIRLLSEKDFEGREQDALRSMEFSATHGEWLNETGEPFHDGDRTWPRQYRTLKVLPAQEGSEPQMSVNSTSSYAAGPAGFRLVFEYPGFSTER